MRFTDALRSKWEQQEYERMMILRVRLRSFVLRNTYIWVECLCTFRTDFRTTGFVGYLN
jgi:hypothetical protein